MFRVGDHSQTKQKIWVRTHFEESQWSDLAVEPPIHLFEQATMRLRESPPGKVNTTAFPFNNRLDQEEIPLCD